MILVFSHAHPSISKGGAEVSAYTLFKGLRELGRQAKFIAMCPANQIANARTETDDEMIVPYDPARYDHLFHVGSPSLSQILIEALTPLNPTALVFHHFLFLGTNTIAALIERFQVPSAIVLHEFLAICHHHGQMVTRPGKKLCAKASPTRCATCFPELAPEELHARKTQFLELLNSATKLISPSHFLAKRFIEWGMKQEKFTVIENGLAGYRRPSTIQPPRNAKHFLRTPAKSKSFVFGYFGQINPFKGIDLILDALNQLEQQNSRNGLTVRVHGNIVGVTDEFMEAFEKAEQRGLIEYHGPYANADVHTLMTECDYILMASKWWENSPVVIQEAYAARRPVLAPKLGGMEEKVQPGIGGQHFEFGDINSLACALAVCRAERSEYKIPLPQTAVEMAHSYIESLSI